MRHAINNRVYTLLLGGAVLAHLKNTTDDNFYTHYSTSDFFINFISVYSSFFSLSTVEANWNFGNLGRGDTNKTLASKYW